MSALHAGSSAWSAMVRRYWATSRYTVCLHSTIALRQAGIGVLATIQQSSLALGVATLGSLYLVLASDLGPAHAAQAILGVLMPNVLGVGAMSRGLPEPRA
jgi:hypothetical protein